MKVIAFNGSPRKGGNTEIMLKTALTALEAEGIETELIQLANKKMEGCIACYGCFEKKNHRCVIKNDDMNECIEKMESADGIIIGSPTYFANVTSKVKSLIDRAGLVGRANDNMFKHKAGAAVVAVRRAGSCNVFSSINYFFLLSEMIIPGSIYWNMGIGLEKGDVSEDAEGMETMTVLGKNMAWLIKKTAD